MMDQGVVMDEVFLSIGWWGRYQRIQFLMTMLPVLACAVHVMSVVFIGRAVQHTCSPLTSLNITLEDGGQTTDYDVILNSRNLSLNVTYGACSVDVTNGSHVVYSSTCLNGYQYAEPRDRSFVSEWDLVCEGESLSDVSQTLLSLGQMAGALIFTALADVYGRKPTYMITHLLLFAVAVGIAFSPSFIVFAVLRFLIGAFQQGTGLISNVLLLEMLPTQQRALPSQVGSYVWPGSLLVLCLCAYVTKDVSWQYTELLLAGLSIYVLFQWWITDESIRWLLANNKLATAEKILYKATKSNKVDFNKALELMRSGDLRMSTLPTELKVQDSVRQTQVHDSDRNMPDVSSSEVPVPSAPASEELRFSAFVRNKNIFVITAISCYMWFADSLTYYGLLMTSTSLTDDFYLGFFVNVLVELPAAFAFGVLINRIGRKKCIFIFHVIAGFSLLTSEVLSNAPFAEAIPGRKWIIMGVSLLGKFGISVGFGTLFLYSPELYPTNLRNSGFGISSMAARVGGMVAPYSRTFARHVAWGPGAVFTCLCLLVPVLIGFLPETHGHELPQTIADMDKWIDSTRRKRSKKDRHGQIH
ncbi:organic cation transporter protein-like [Physella acuta]|uniref:organic cation transporter protein-like n=1 Tax=Physella acuta TaxID=109671 RepID=UPI0027DB33B2|nr:organic cation transporter protein-like [Physella acuta]